MEVIKVVNGCCGATMDCKNCKCSVCGKCEDCEVCSDKETCNCYKKHNT